MLVEQAVGIYLTYLEENTRPNTLRSFGYTLSKFSGSFGSSEMKDVSESEIIRFITDLSKGLSSSTKRNRVSILRALYNFTIEVTEATYSNPCLRPMIKKLFKGSRFSSPKLLDKDLIDEIIFRTTDERDRLILELMGRAGMRIGEVLNIKNSDINFNDSTILISEPKSGRKGEKVYATKKLCSRLHNYLIKRSIAKDTLVFKISYSTAYRMVVSAGNLVGHKLRPHDLRRHAATQASRNNIPLEVVSKVILRHADISTTQRYLGSIDPEEASRWVEHLNK